MDDGEVAHQANFDVMRFQVPDRYRNRRLLQKTGAIDQRFVRIGAIKILSEDFIETLYVGILDGADVIAVEAGQFGNVVSHGFSSADDLILLMRHSIVEHRWRHEAAEFALDQLS